MSEYDDIHVLDTTGMWPNQCEPEWAVKISECYDCSSTHAIVLVKGLKADIERLRLLHSQIMGECVYCGLLFDQRDKANRTHWETCEKHPARFEVERLRARVAELELTQFLV